MVQHAVITNSLKIGLPEDVLALITVSKGYRVMSQSIKREFQQVVLKVHAKKRSKLVSS